MEPVQNGQDGLRGVDQLWSRLGSQTELLSERLGRDVARRQIKCSVCR